MKYIDIYEPALKVMNGMSSLAEIKVMLELYVRYGNKGIFSVTEPTRVELSNNLRVSKTSIVNAMSALVAKGVVIKEAHNTYKMNDSYISVTR